jgi:hypothetical protein
MCDEEGQTLLKASGLFNTGLPTNACRMRQYRKFPVSQGYSEVWQLCELMFVAWVRMRSAISR